MRDDYSSMSKAELIKKAETHERDAAYSQRSCDRLEAEYRDPRPGWVLTDLTIDGTAAKMHREEAAHIRELIEKL